MRSSKTLLVILPLLTLLSSFFVPVAAFPHEGLAQKMEPSRIVESDASSVDTFNVVLSIVGPDGLPSVGIQVAVFHNILSKKHDPYETTETTDSYGNASFNLARGSHIAILHNQASKPQYLAIFRFYLREDSSFRIDVSDLTYPVVLEAIKPLVDRPFTANSYFAVKILVYPNLMPFWFTEDNVDDQSCNATLYLPRNMKYSFAFEDDGAYYTLFVKNAQINKPNTSVKFDASRTGLLNAAFTSPSGGFEFDLLFLLLRSDDPLPYTVALFIGDESSSPWAVTVGSYNIVASGVYSEEVDSIERFDYWFDFEVGRKSVKSKKLTTVNFGGDLTGSMKAKKKSYKVGEQVLIDYLFSDAYRHKVTWASIHRYEFEDGSWAWKERLYPPFILNIYDSEGLVESEDLFYYSIYGTLQLYSYTFGEPGSYNVELVLDSGPYQGEVTGTTQVSLK